MLRNTQGIASGRDVVSEVQTMVSDIRRMLKNREEIDGQHQPVSITHTPSVTEYTFTVTQTQKRSVIVTTEGASALHLHLACLGNRLLLHQGSSLDGAS